MCMYICIYMCVFTYTFIYIKELAHVNMEAGKFKVGRVGWRPRRGNASVLI